MNPAFVSPGTMGAELVGPDAVRIEVDADRAGELMIRHLRARTASGFDVNWRDQVVAVPTNPASAGMPIVIGFEPVGRWALHVEEAGIPSVPLFRPALLRSEAEGGAHGSLRVGVLRLTGMGRIEFEAEPVWGNRLDCTPELSSMARDARDLLREQDDMIEQIICASSVAGNAPDGLAWMLMNVASRLDSAWLTLSDPTSHPKRSLGLVAAYVDAIADLPDRALRMRRMALRDLLARLDTEVHDNGKHTAPGWRIGPLIDQQISRLKRIGGALEKLFAALAFHPVNGLPSPIYREDFLYQREAEPSRRTDTTNRLHTEYRITVPDIDRNSLFLALLWRGAEPRMGDVVISLDRNGKGTKKILGGSRVGYHWLPVARGDELFVVATSRLTLGDCAVYSNSGHPPPRS